MNYIRDNLDTYSSMIKSEVGYASTNDYFSRKLRTDHQVIGLIYLHLERHSRREIDVLGISCD